MFQWVLAQIDTIPVCQAPPLCVDTPSKKISTNHIHTSHRGAQARPTFLHIRKAYIPNPLFDVVFEDLSEVLMTASARLDHVVDTIRLEEHVMIALDRILKRFVGKNLRLSLEESLQGEHRHVHMLLRETHKKKYQKHSVFVECVWKF